MAAKSPCPISPKHVLVTGPPGVGKTTLIRRVCNLLQTGHGVTVRGFYTEEVRGDGPGAGLRGRGPRIGFDVVTLDGKRGPLARVDGAESAAFPARKSPSVGKYGVDVGSFEALALPTLDLQALDKTGGDVPPKGVTSGELTGGADVSQKKVLVIDEIGKMELFSRDFMQKIKSLFERASHTTSSSGGCACGDGGVVLLATIPVHRPHQKSHWLLGEIRQRKDCKLYEVDEKNRDQLVQEITSFIMQTK